MPLRNAARRSARLGLGTSLETRSPADSLSAPVASPFVSRTIFPFGGSGISRAIPASAKALLFAHELWPSKATRKTGRSGTTASRNFLWGSALGPKVGYVHPAPLIQGSLGCEEAYSFTRFWISSTVFVPIR